MAGRLSADTEGRAGRARALVSTRVPGIMWAEAGFTGAETGWDHKRTHHVYKKRKQTKRKQKQMWLVQRRSHLAGFSAGSMRSLVFPRIKYFCEATNPISKQIVNADRHSPLSWGIP